MAAKEKKVKKKKSWFRRILKWFAYTIQLYDVSVTGRTEFKGVKLAEIKQIEAHVGLWDVIGGDQIEIDEVHVTDATFDVRVAPDGKANYDIVIPTEELPAHQT